MGKASAFGTTFSIGTCQVEAATLVGTITQSGNATVITTAAGMSGSPITTNVAVLINDTPDTVATKITAALNAVANITAKFEVYCSGALVYLRRLIAAADDATLNISVANGTCLGITNDATSDAIIAGVASAAVAYVSNVGGPGLSADTADVTTHDSASGWDEVVITVLRSGEVTLELEFDPLAATHSNATDGLSDRYENKKATYCIVTFPGAVAWSFRAYVTGFTPSSPADGALTASVKLKIFNVPTLV